MSSTHHSRRTEAPQPPEPEELEPPAFFLLLLPVVRSVVWIILVSGGTTVIQTLLNLSLYESATLSLGICLLLNVVSARARLSNIEHLLEKELSSDSMYGSFLENLVDQIAEEPDENENEEITQEGLDLELIQLLEEKRTIEAINLYREHTGCGLKEAKVYIKTL